MSTAFIYPGQGAQAVGMGSDFFDSPLAAQANDICGFDLVGIMKEGPEDQLQLTSICQPALFLHSALVLEALGENTPSAQWHLGLSLGEYSALYGSGAMSFEAVMKALVVRGRAMQEACEASEGGMVSVLGLEDEKVEAVCDEARGDDVLQAANYNSPGQIVVSGSKAALERSLPLFKEAGARRAMPLKVAGAFHSPLMAPAAEALKVALAEVSIGSECANVISNVTAAPHDPSTVVEGLVDQITAPVRWSQSISNLVEKEGVSSFCEWGTGRILSGLVKRISRDVTLSAAGSKEEISACGCVATS